MAMRMLMCYVHVLRNIGKNKDKYNKENKHEIFRDIKLLDQSPSTNVFEILSRRFWKKWKKKNRVLIFQNEMAGFALQLVFGRRCVHSNYK